MPELSSPDIEAVAEALWDLWRIWRQRSHPIRRGTVTPEQYFLLRRLKKLGPLTVSALARELGVAGATITVATRRLEAAGHIRRERQTDDQRVVLISLSEAGGAALEEWRIQRRRALVDLLTRLRPAERAQLGRLLQRLLEVEA